MLQILDTVPQTVAQVCRRLRMAKGQLATVVSANREGLEARGMQLHVATASETGKAITLASGMNTAEPTFYSKLSRQLTR